MIPVSTKKLSVFMVDTDDDNLGFKKDKWGTPEGAYHSYFRFSESVFTASLES